jgi:hypothetical protein
MRIATEEFRPDGKLAAAESHWNGKLMSRCAYAYDDTGLLLETKHSQEDGTSARTVHEYEGGRLARTVHYDPSGSHSMSQERTYAADGSYKSTVQFPKELGGSDIYCPVGGLDFSFSAPGVASMTTSYDCEDRPSEVLFQTADGKPVRRLVLQHDEAGRLLKVELLLCEEPLFPDVPQFGPGAALATFEYKYDDAGRQVEMVRGMFGMDEQREQYRYDDRGNRVEIDSQQDRSGARIVDSVPERDQPQIHRWQTRVDHQYDDHGNWTERLTLHRQNANPDFTPVSIERRQITYHL